MLPARASPKDSLRCLSAAVASDNERRPVGRVRPTGLPAVDQRDHRTAQRFGDGAIADGFTHRPCDELDGRDGVDGPAAPVA